MWCCDTGISPTDETRYHIGRFVNGVLRVWDIRVAYARVYASGVPRELVSVPLRTGHARVGTYFSTGVVIGVPMLCSEIFLMSRPSFVMPVYRIDFDKNCIRQARVAIC